MAVASAPAKVILFGEHFVVYGQPAIAMAVERRAYVKARSREDESIYVSSTDLGISGFFSNDEFELERGGFEDRWRLEPIRAAVKGALDLVGRKVGVDVEVRSSIPMASGLGSSAAVAVATAKAVSELLGAHLTKEEAFRIAYEAERLVHGSPSGIDPAAASYGGVLLYRGGEITPLAVRADFILVVGYTGVKRSTGELVAKVRRDKERYPLVVNPIIRMSGELVVNALNALEKGDLRALGELMDLNHALLSAIGVSHEALDRLIRAAREAGALGAKLTGAGGGGCMIALARLDEAERIALAIERAGGKAFVTKGLSEGVRVEG